MISYAEHEYTVDVVKRSSYFSGLLYGLILGVAIGTVITAGVNFYHLSKRINKLEASR